MKLLSAHTIRRCFVADPGNSIFTADFDQIELRIAAALSGESALIEAAKRGESLHKIAAVKLFGVDYTQDQYRYCKNVNFGWLYGGGPKTLSDQAGIPFEAARKIIKEYESAFPALTAYKRQQQNAILKSALGPNGYRVHQMLRSRMYHFRSDTAEGRRDRAAIARELKMLCHGKLGYVTTPFGRRLPVDAEKPYSVVNYKIQSIAADILKTSFLWVMDDAELNPTVLLPVHDELLGQAPTRRAKYFARRYGEVMSTEFQGVPITASGKVYGHSWGHGYGA